jgi:predicted amidohydrolase YtcJ
VPSNHANPSPPSARPTGRPPLREAHAHLLPYGLSLAIPSLAGCADLAGCLAELGKVVAEARRGLHGGWARLSHAHHNHWPEARWPTVAELDAVTGSTPTVIMSFDHHAAVCNTAALAAAGLVAGQAVAPNGKVEADAAGAFTGLLSEQAAYKVWFTAPQPGEPERLAALAKAVASLAALGFAEVHDMLAEPELPRLLARLDAAGHLPLRVVLYTAPENLGAMVHDRASWPRRVRLGGAKLFADGTLSSRTALMMHRYTEPLADASRGRCMVAPAAIGQTVARCHDLGVGLAVHAIGDAAVKMVLDCVERFDSQLGSAQAGAARRCRVRIEHAELIDKMDVPRFVRQRVDCSVQPCHLLTDIEALNRYVPHRLDRVLPLRELLDAGLQPGRLGVDWETMQDVIDPADVCAAPAGLVFGSDAPIVRPEPEDSIFAAVHRRRPELPESQAIAPLQALTEDECWKCFAAP